MRFKVGEQPVPGYRLDAFLGAGSYGEVWKVIGPGGVPCAMKFISLDSKSGLKEFRSIGLVKKLQHPNLCPVQAIWLRDDEGNVLSDSDQNSITIRMLGPKELIIAMGLGRKTLAQRLEETRGRGIPPHELLRYMVDAARGIDYLNSPEHDLGSGPSSVIHCDIKPANLLIVGGGVQVCDYGVIRALGPDTLRKTFAAGTPAYAPPELINNEPCPQTDQYSLAITYYELRTGQLPFDETKAIVANLTGQLDLSLVAGNDEREVLRQALALQPNRRFATCEEFVDTLRVASGITLGRPPSGVHAHPTSRTVPGAAPGTGSSSPLQQPGSDRESWPQSTPFADRPTPRVTPTPLPPDPVEQKPPSRPIPSEPPRRSPIPDSGTLQLEPPDEVEVKFISGPVAPPRGTPTPEPPIPKGSGIFIDDEERQASRAGAFLPLAIGLVLFLGLMATGVYIFFIKDGTGTPPTSEPTQTKSTENGTSGTGKGTPPTKLETPPTKLETPPTKNGNPQIPITTKDYAPELKAAREHFALAKVDAQQIQKGLAELAKIPDSEPTKPDDVRDAAKKLKTWWTKAQTAGDSPLKDFREKFPQPQPGDVETTDEGALNAYRRGKITKAIADVIPGLDAKTNWEELATACGEADPNAAVVEACLAECWAEGPEAARQGKPYDAVTLAAPLKGYSQYVALRLKQVQKAPLAETATAFLPEVEKEDKDLPSWLNDRRAAEMVKAFREAAKSAPSVASRLLAVAERKASTTEQFDIRYSRLMEGWEDGAMKDALRPELKKISQELEKSGAERVKKLTTAEQFKFWAAVGSAYLDPSNSSDAVRAYTKAMEFAKDVKAADLRKYVFDPITAEAFTKSLTKDAENAATLYRQAGQYVRRNRANWDKGQAEATNYAAGLFHRAVQLTPKPDDVAWWGLLAAESPTRPVAEMIAATKHLGDSKNDTLAVAVFRGLAAHLQAKEKDSREIALKGHDQFVQALETSEKSPDLADERRAALRWATANASWLVTKSFPASTSLPKATEKPEDAPTAETYYWLGTVEQRRYEESSKASLHCPLESHRAKAIDLLAQGFQATNGQPSAWADVTVRELAGLQVAYGTRQLNRGRKDAAKKQGVGLTPLLAEGVRISPAYKGWLQLNQSLLNPKDGAVSFAPFYKQLKDSLAAVKTDDAEAEVRLHTLRAWLFLGAIASDEFPKEWMDLKTRLAEGKKAAKTAVDRLADGAKVPAEVAAEARGAYGVYLYLDGELTDARTAFQEAIALAPWHDIAFSWKYWLGLAIDRQLSKAAADAKEPEQISSFALMAEAAVSIRDAGGGLPGVFKAFLADDMKATIGNRKSAIEKLPAAKVGPLGDLGALALRMLADRDYALTNDDVMLLEKVKTFAAHKDADERVRTSLDRQREWLVTLKDCISR